MIILLSPAKSLDETAEPPKGNETTAPRFEADSEELVSELRKLSVPQLKSLLDVSDDLTRLNHGRYKQWDVQSKKPCLYAFDGPAFVSLKAAPMSPQQVGFAQKHLRILSGVYGLLRPLDMIKLYRLDMGKKLKNSRGPDLYAFWSAKVVEAINQELDACPVGERFVINCASQEYFKCVDKCGQLRHPVITCSFPGPSVYAKQARGSMTGFVIREDVTNIARLKEFTGNSGEWKFDSSKSSDTDLVFVRDASMAARNSGEWKFDSSKSSDTDLVFVRDASMAAKAKQAGDNKAPGGAKKVTSKEEKAETKDEAPSMNARAKQVGGNKAPGGAKKVISKEEKAETKDEAPSITAAKAKQAGGNKAPGGAKKAVARKEKEETKDEAPLEKVSRSKRLGGIKRKEGQDKQGNEGAADAGAGAGAGVKSEEGEAVEPPSKRSTRASSRGKT
eukprot:gene108-5520_t